MQEHEEQKERYAGYDVRVEHRDVVEEGDGLLAPSLHVVYAYCRDGPEHGGHDSCYKGY